MDTEEDDNIIIGDLVNVRGICHLVQYRGDDDILIYTSIDIIIASIYIMQDIIVLLLYM